MPLDPNLLCRALSKREAHHCLRIGHLALPTSHERVPVPSEMPFDLDRVHEGPVRSLRHRRERRGQSATGRDGCRLAGRVPLHDEVEDLGPERDEPIEPPPPLDVFEDQYDDGGPVRPLKQGALDVVHGRLVVDAPSRRAARGGGRGTPR